MSLNAKTKLKWPFASVALDDAYTDFILSRQAMNVAPSTITFYHYTAGKFLAWVDEQGITEPNQVSARHVRQYLAGLVSRGLKDNSVHDHARAIKTLLIFWHDEGYIAQRIKFEMPKLFHKRLLVLTPEQLQVLLKACRVRDKAIVLLLVDRGLRRFETASLNWGDVDFQTGLVRVRSGKGRKDRSAVIGATTRRALLAYRRTLAHCDDKDPLIQSRDGQRLSGNALLTMCRRLTKRTGIRVTPHALRRTFAILSLRAGMSPLHLQALGGWEGLDMVKHYAQMVDDDLLQAHTEHSPIDNLSRLK